MQLLKTIQRNLVFYLFFLFNFNLEKIKYWAIRTKQEARTSLSEAAKLSDDRSKTILFYAYSLWFLQLPSLIAVARNKTKILRLAFKVKLKLFLILSYFDKTLGFK